MQTAGYTTSGRIVESCRENRRWHKMAMRVIVAVKETQTKGHTNKYILNTLILHRKEMMAQNDDEDSYTRVSILSS